MERSMSRRVSQMEHVLGGRSDLSRLSDAELETALDDVEKRLLELYATSLDCFSTPEQADQAEAALRQIMARGEAAARLIAGRMAPRSSSKEVSP
jgi:hypothetical protein